MTTTQTNPLRRYLVTVTPSVTVYTGSHTGGAYKVEAFAATRAKAISQARKQRRDEEGREAVPADYSARMLKLTDADRG